MEAGLLKNLGKIAGLAGIVAGIFLIIFRDVLKQKLIPEGGLSGSQAFHIILALIILTFGMAVVGILAWIVTKQIEPARPAPQSSIMLLGFLVIAILVTTVVVAINLPEVLQGTKDSSAKTDVSAAPTSTSSTQSGASAAGGHKPANPKPQPPTGKPAADNQPGTKGQPEVQKPDDQKPPVRPLVVVAPPAPTEFTVKINNDRVNNWLMPVMSGNGGLWLTGVTIKIDDVPYTMPIIGIGAKAKAGMNEQILTLKKGEHKYRFDLTLDGRRYSTHTAVPVECHNKFQVDGNIELNPFVTIKDDLAIQCELLRLDQPIPQRSSN